MTEAEAVEFIAHAPFERRPAVEQAQACADLEEQRVRRRETDVRTVAISPSCESFERLSFSGFVARRDGQSRAQQLRAGDRLSTPYA